MDAIDIVRRYIEEEIIHKLGPRRGSKVKTPKQTLSTVIKRLDPKISAPSPKINVQDSQVKAPDRPSFYDSDTIINIHDYSYRLYSSLYQPTPTTSLSRNVSFAQDTPPSQNDKINVLFQKSKSEIMKPSRSSFGAVASRNIPPILDPSLRVFYSESVWKRFFDQHYEKDKVKHHFFKRVKSITSSTSKVKKYMKAEEASHYAQDYMKLLASEYDVCMDALSDISSSVWSCFEDELQRTLVILKPDAMCYQQVVLRAIHEAGFQIVGRRVVHITAEQLADIYSKYYGSPTFAHLIFSLSIGPSLVLSIAGIDVVKRWQTIVGLDGSLKKEWFYPSSMRKLFGIVEMKSKQLISSDNVPSAYSENRYFFPENVLDPILTSRDAVTDYCEVNINRILAFGCTELAKRRPKDPISYLANWLLLNNPNQPKLPSKIATAPT